MRARHVILTPLFVAAALLAAPPAMAQQPICRSAPEQRPTYTACSQGSFFGVTRLLTDFTVDHLFKPAPPRFRRSLHDFVRPLAGREVQADGGLADYLTAVPEIGFTQLDRSTGVLAADFTETERSFNATVDAFGASRKVSVTLPPRLDGGYWRAPDALHMAFWEGKRVAFTVELGNGRSIGGEIACVALSTDELTLTLAGDSAAEVLVSFRDCQ